MTKLWDLIRKNCSPQRSQSSQRLIIRRWNDLGHGVGGGHRGFSRVLGAEGIVVEISELSERTQGEYAKAKVKR